MTRDPVPDHGMGRSWLPTETWWIHDYCLLFSAIWNFGYGLCSYIYRL